MENLYILLELPIDPIEHDEQKINDALNKKITEWQRDSKNPKKAIIAKEYIQQVPEIKKILGDYNLRQEIAKEAISIRDEKLNALNNDILIRTIDKELSESDIEFLYSKYKKYGITKEYIISNFSKLNSEFKANDFNIPDFSKNIASQLVTHMKSLSINSCSLYEYLHIDDKSSIDIINTVIDSKLKIIIQKGTKTNNDELEQKILGLAKIIFSSNLEKSNYDEWLSFSYNIHFSELIQDALQVNKILNKNVLATLMQIASKEYAINTDEATRYIIYNTKYLDYDIDESVETYLEDIRQKEIELEKQRQQQKKEEERIRREKELEQQRLEEEKRRIELEQIELNKNKKIEEAVQQTTNYINSSKKKCVELNNNMQNHFNKRINGGFQTFPDEMILILYIAFSLILLVISMYINVVTFKNNDQTKYLYIIALAANVVNVIRAFYINYLSKNIRICVDNGNKMINEIDNIIKKINNLSIDDDFKNNYAHILNEYNQNIHKTVNATCDNYNKWVKMNNKLKYSRQGYFKPWITYVWGYSAISIGIYILLTFL